MQNFCKVITGLFFVSLSLSCARQSSEKTELRLEWSASSSFKAMNEDESMPPAFFTVSRLDGTQPMHFHLLPHESRVLDLPRGSVVIQALLFSKLAYPGLSENDSDGGMQPYFAEQAIILDQAEQSVVLSLQTPKNFITGEVAGRYLSASNAGPTGDVEYNIKIKSHLPPIKLGKVMDKSYIINGWFQFFALRSDDVLGIEYLLADGTNVFGPGAIKNLDNLVEIPFDRTQPTQQVQLAVPWSAKTRYDNPGGGTPILVLDGFREPEVYTLGFWGPGRAANQSAQFYFNDASFNFTELENTYVYQSDLKVQDETALMTYTGDSVNKITITKVTSPLGNRVAQLQATTSVTAGSALQRGSGQASIRGDHNQNPAATMDLALVLDFKTLVNSGKDGFGAFRGFLRAANYPAVSSYPNSFNGWTHYRNPSDKFLHVLPGIKIEALSVYLSNSDNLDDRELDCNNMNSLTAYNGAVELSGTSEQTTTIELNPFPSLAKHLVLCPTFTNQYKPSKPTVLYFHQYQGPCSGPNPTAGTVCDDGTAYLGTMSFSDSIYRYFSAPATDVQYTWGPVNTSSLLISEEGAVNGGYADSNYSAANFCKSLGSLSYNDWFLPSPSEFVVFHNQLDDLEAPFTMVPGEYWTSKQEDNYDAFIYQTASGSTTSSAVKSESKKVRCLRRTLIN